jgi:hypothetical protein
MTVKTSQLEGRRNDYEDDLLIRLSECIPAFTAVTVLADRAFGDAKLYRLLVDLGFGFVIRFRGVIRVETPEGEVREAAAWVPSNGRIREIVDARVTAEKRTQVGAVVAVKCRGMKEPWILATSFQNQAKRVVKLYGRRFTCEENFRDEKDRRFGLGSKQARASTCERRDRMLVVHALATVILTLLGAAGETMGLDRHLKSNTASRRIHSLFRQGRLYIRGVQRDCEQALEKLWWRLIRSQPSVAEELAWI